MGASNQNRRGGLRAGSLIVTVGSCVLFTAGGLAWVHQGRVHQALGEKIANAERQIRNLEVQLVEDRREYTYLSSWPQLRQRATNMGLTEVPFARRIFIYGHAGETAPVESLPAAPAPTVSRGVGATIATLPH
ncbi:MAG TPA: hypothetical protein VMF06_18530 [Candidatus Limnocylindria bacterium]|jgi:hypothetical protein|nr:hypothetical protein [Candidatus Limnocylindria bacterium]